MVDRYIIFKELKDLIEFGDTYFEDFQFNPLQILVSALFTETVSYMNEKGRGSEQLSLNTNQTNLYTQKLKWKIKYLKDKLKASTLLTAHRQAVPLLFLPIEPTHISQMKPVFESLKKLNKDFIIATNRSLIYENVKDSFPSIFLPKKVTLLPSNLEQKMLKCIQLLFSTYSQQANTTLPLRFMQQRIEAELNGLVNLYHQFEELIHYLKPSKVFVGNDSTLEGRLMTFLARKQANLKSYCLMHGSVSGEPLDTYHQVDCFLTYGQVSFDDLVRNGMDPARLKVSGAPYMDQFLFKGESDIHPVLKAKLGLSSDKPYVLITNSGPGHSTSHAHYQTTLDAIFRLHEAIEGIQWVIKLHRKDSLANFKNILSTYPENSIHIIEHHTEGFPTSIFEWLQGATCLLTGCSTVAIEAMTLDIPVITMDYMNEFRHVDFIDQKATIHVTNYEELHNAMSTLLSDIDQYKPILAKAKEFAQHYFHKREISASDFIAHELTT